MYFKDPNPTPTKEPERVEVRDVKVIVTSQIVDYAYIKSYPYVDSHAYYEVPVYKMFLEGIDENKSQKKFEYQVIRFGVAWENGINVKDIYVCGLQEENEYTVIEWNPTAISGHGGYRFVGAHYIHVGSRNPKLIRASAYDYSGALGCIEIVKGKFSEFQDNLLMLSGAVSYVHLGRSGKFKVKIEAAERPTRKKHKIM